MRGFISDLQYIRT